jgi:hypothetical protein
LLSLFLIRKGASSMKRAQVLAMAVATALITLIFVARAKAAVDVSTGAERSAAVAAAFGLGSVSPSDALGGTNSSQPGWINTNIDLPGFQLSIGTSEYQGSVSLDASLGLTNGIIQGANVGSYPDYSNPSFTWTYINIYGMLGTPTARDPISQSFSFSRNGESLYESAGLSSYTDYKNELYSVGYGYAQVTPLVIDSAYGSYSEYPGGGKGDVTGSTDVYINLNMQWRGKTSVGVKGLMESTPVDVTFGSVPEPSSIALIGGVPIVGLLRRRRRR